MANADSKYTVEITFKAMEDGKDELPMNDSTLVWSGVNYATLCAFEELMVGVLGHTTNWGKLKAEELGQGDELRSLLGEPQTKPKK